MDDPERPQFLLGFPQDPELDRVAQAFERGDYRRVRDLAPSLIARTDRPEISTAARELLARTEPDPLVKYLLLVALALFGFLVIWAYQGHTH